MRSLWKSRFCQYLRKYQHSKKRTFLAHISENFEGNDVFLRLFWKNVFCPYTRKYKPLEKKDVLSKSLSKIVLIWAKISTFWGNRFFFFKKSSKINIKIQVKCIFYRYLWKIVFCPHKNLPENINISRKIIYCPYIQNINISRKKTFPWYHF